ncbi:MAG: hypothetical protein JWO78_753 [Micavibrio sp.]|nr:hypothetical protein [Micavibrio sp.]
MQTKKIFLMTVAMMTLSGSAHAQTATQVQQQKTEAATAGQAARTNAATAEQAQKTQAAAADQARKTEAAAQPQAAETAARVQEQQSRGQYLSDDPAASAAVQTGNVNLYNANPYMPYYPAFTSGQGVAPNNPARANEINQAQQGTANTTNSPNEKRLQDLFNAIDTDRNGLITMTEFSIYYKSPPDDPRFMGYDANRDLMISYFEFRAPNVTGADVSIPTH